MHASAVFARRWTRERARGRVEKWRRARWMFSSFFENVFEIDQSRSGARGTRSSCPRSNSLRASVRRDDASRETPLARANGRRERFSWRPSPTGVATAARVSLRALESWCVCVGQLFFGLNSSSRRLREVRRRRRRCARDSWGVCDDGERVADVGDDS